MAESSSSARALTDPCGRWLQIGLAAVCLALAGTSPLAAQEPCASEDAEGCDARRWQRTREPAPQSPPQPSAASAATESAGEAEAKPWRSMLLRERPADDLPASRRWYGWQTLIADALGLSALLLQNETGVAITGTIALLAAPVVHFAHENVSAGSLSFGMRALAGGLITAGILISVEDISIGGVEETVGAIVTIAGLTSYAAAIIVDASVLAYGEVRAEPRRSYGFVPWLDPKRGGAGVRLALVL